MARTMTPNTTPNTTPNMTPNSTPNPARTATARERRVPGSVGGGSRIAPRFTRRHRSTLRQLDRRALERAGWRTTLELQENHVRLADGRLVEVDRSWLAEAERDGVVIGCSARSESRAWSRVFAEAERRHRGSCSESLVGASA